MMQEITQYLADNLIHIQIDFDATIKTRNRTVYTRTINLYRGIDNVVKLQFKNQDQKTVDLTGKTVTFNILDDRLGRVVFSRVATPVVITKGIFTVDIYENDFLGFAYEYFNYSIITTDDVTGVRTQTYADDNYTARGQIHVLDSHYPQFHPSEVVALNNMYTPTPYTPMSINTTSIVPGPSNTHENVLHTAQIYFNSTGFSGNVTIQGTLDPVADFLAGNWFNIETIEYTNHVAPDYTNWEGVHNFIRFQIIPTSGSITKILYRS